MTKVLNELGADEKGLRGRERLALPCGRDEDVYAIANRTRASTAPMREVKSGCRTRQPSRKGRHYGVYGAQQDKMAWEGCLERIDSDGRSFDLHTGGT